MIVPLRKSDAMSVAIFSIPFVGTVSIAVVLQTDAVSQKT